MKINDFLKSFRPTVKKYLSHFSAKYLRIFKFLSLVNNVWEITRIKYKQRKAASQQWKNMKYLFQPT